MADQSKRIVFQNEEGGVSVLIPPRDEDCELTLEQIAAKDVPPLITFIPNGTYRIDEETGEELPNGETIASTRPYKIVDASDIPADRSQRMAWAVDAADLTDGVGE